MVSELRELCRSEARAAGMGRRIDWIIIMRDGSMVGFRVVGDVVLIMMVVIDIRRGRCDNGGVVVVERFTSRVIHSFDGIIGISISVRRGLITRGIRGVIIIVIRVGCVGERIIVRVRVRVRGIIDVVVCNVVHIGKVDTSGAILRKQSDTINDFVGHG